VAYLRAGSLEALNQVGHRLGQAVLFRATRTSQRCSESGNAQQHLMRGRVDFESFSRRWVLGAGGGLNSNLGASCGPRCPVALFGVVNFCLWCQY